MNALTLLTALVGVAHCRDIFVSPTGKGTGSLDAPYGSIQSAVDAAKPGDSILLRAGTYAPSKNIQIVKKSGTEAAPITFRPYEKEKVILDGENMPGTPYGLGESLPNKERGILHIQNSEYWKFYDLELIHGPYCIYARDASNNYYEQISTHHCHETGFQLEGESSNNKVINIDSYSNYDARKAGEGSDGIGIKSGSGKGNLIKNARLWGNSDDGIDLFMFADGITLEEVYAFENGFTGKDKAGEGFNGDGNGYKLGITGSPAAPHSIKSCYAWGNAAKGFIDNGNPATLTFENNVAYDNALEGFQMRSSSSTMKGNVAVGNNVKAGGKEISLIDKVKHSGNSWNSKKTFSKSSFKSTDPKTLKGPRGADGRVVVGDFLVLKEKL